MLCRAQNQITAAYRMMGEGQLLPDIFIKTTVVCFVVTQTVTCNVKPQLLFLQQTAGVAKSHNTEIFQIAT